MRGDDSSTGVSWWDWQEASASEWQAIGAPLAATAPPGPALDFAVVGSGGKGDLVIWAQEHLNAAGQKVSVDGQFGPQTQAAVEAFQKGAGLPPTGKIDTATWKALLRYTPPHYSWATGQAQAASANSRGITGPPTAHLPAKRDEIPPAASRH